MAENEELVLCHGHPLLDLALQTNGSGGHLQLGNVYIFPGVPGKLGRTRFEPDASGTKLREYRMADADLCAGGRIYLNIASVMAAKGDGLKVNAIYRAPVYSDELFVFNGSRLLLLTQKQALHFTMMQCIEQFNSNEAPDSADALQMERHGSDDFTTNRRDGFGSSSPGSGFSHLQCKMLGPMFSLYKATRDQAVTEWSTGGCIIWEQAIKVPWSFSILPEDVNAKGFGQDKQAAAYMPRLLAMLTAANEGNPGLVPLHVDRDGNCLVHSLSRCLVGQEVLSAPVDAASIVTALVDAASVVTALVDAASIVTALVDAAGVVARSSPQYQSLHAGKPRESTQEPQP